MLCDIGQTDLLNNYEGNTVTVERIDDLGLNGLKLIQNTELFCFGTDSVLLTDFVRAGSRDTVVDFCTGNGIIPVLLSAKTKASKIIGMEILRPSYELAVRNADINGLSGRIEFINDDIKNWKNYFKHGSVDVVTVNPPYMIVGAGFKNPDDFKAVARHEIYIDFDGICRCASDILKFGGHFFAVHRADRLCDVVSSMRKYKLEPKRIAFISPSPECAANLILIEGMLGAGASLKIEKPIYVNL